MIVGFIISLWRKFKKTFRKDEYFVFWSSLFFHFLLYFNINNKTLLGLFLFFLFIFLIRLKNPLIVFFILYLLFFPFGKGKTFHFTLIPARLINMSESYTYGFTVTFADLAFLGVFALLIREEIFGRINQRLKLKNGDFYLFAFLLFVFVSLFFSQFQMVSFLAFLKMVRMVAVYFIVQRILFEKKMEKIIPLILATMLIFQGAWAGLQFFFQRPLGKAIEPYDTPFSAYGHVAAEEKTFFRAQGTLDHPNTLGSFSIIFLFFLFFQIFNPNQGDDKKKIFSMSFLVGTLGLIFSASRASWLTFVAMMLGALIFLKRKGVVVFSLIKNWLSWSLFLGVTFFPFLILPRLSHFYLTWEEKGGVYYRTYLLEKAWLLAQESPLGVGLATFPAVLIEKFGFFTWPTPVHNLFLEILAETGIFSLVFFLFFLISTYKRFFLSLKNPKSQSRFFLKTGAFFASLSFLGVAQFYPFFWASNLFEIFWLFLGIMLC